MSAHIIKFQLATPARDHLNGAAIIDDRGRETPITEHMIQHSIQELLRHESRTHANDNVGGVTAAPRLRLVQADS
jgi:hypothetical protein